MSNLYASLILREKELDPQEITSRIGITPSNSFKKGDIRQDGKPWPHGFWELNSSDHVEADDISLHLKWIVDQVYSSKLELLNITNNQKIKGEISCFWIVDHTHGVVNLDSHIINKIAELGLSLEFDFYFDEN